MADKTKVTITGVDDIRIKFKKFLRASERDPAILSDVAVTTREQIIKRTQASLDEYKQPDLAQSTKDRRKKLIAAGNGSNFAKPTRSNLTLSSQLLNAIIFRINIVDGIVNFFFKDHRNPYIGVRGKPLETQTNTEIKYDLEQQGRRFMFLSAKLTSQLQTRIIRALRRRLSNFNKLKKNLS